METPRGFQGVFHALIPRLSLRSNRWAEISERLRRNFENEPVPKLTFVATLLRRRPDRQTF